MDGEFTTTQDVAEVALMFASFPSTSLGFFWWVLGVWTEVDVSTLLKAKIRRDL